ncbi:MAG: response regulator [Leptolyngbyaceae cyanobacterium]
MNQRQILIIDDEPDIREIAKLSLQLTKKWDVLTAASGADGIALATQEQPDAILLDLLMPEMDGLATLKQLNSNPRTQQIPVVLLTATVKLAIQDDYVQLGAKGTLIKPFDPGILGDQIEQVLGWVALT